MTYVIDDQALFDAALARLEAHVEIPMKAVAPKFVMIVQEAYAPNALTVIPTNRSGDRVYDYRVPYYTEYLP